MYRSTLVLACLRRSNSIAAADGEKFSVAEVSDISCHLVFDAVDLHRLRCAGPHVREQHHIIFCRIQSSERLVGNAGVRQRDTTFQLIVAEFEISCGPWAASE